VLRRVFLYWRSRSFGSSNVRLQEFGNGGFDSFRCFSFRAGKSMPDAFQRKEFVVHAKLFETQREVLRFVVRHVGVCSAVNGTSALNASLGDSGPLKIAAYFFGAGGAAGACGGAGGAGGASAFQVSRM
jgi:hypothetical protein